MTCRRRVARSICVAVVPDGLGAGTVLVSFDGFETVELAAGVAVCMGVGVPDAMMSASTMAPLGPLPETLSSAMPRSRATRRARGVARIR